ncbi:MAG: hypothetical protein WCO06_07345, partial [Candidatus Roizmanbacteria bacterium]
TFVLCLPKVANLCYWGIDSQKLNSLDGIMSILMSLSRLPDSINLGQPQEWNKYFFCNIDPEVWFATIMAEGVGFQYLVSRYSHNQVKNDLMTPVIGLGRVVDQFHNCGSPTTEVDGVLRHIPNVDIDEPTRNVIPTCGELVLLNNLIGNAGKHSREQNRNNTVQDHLPVQVTYDPVLQTYTVTNVSNRDPFAEKGPFAQLEEGKLGQEQIIRHLGLQIVLEMAQAMGGNAQCVVAKDGERYSISFSYTRLITQSQ